MAPRIPGLPEIPPPASPEDLTNAEIGRSGSALIGVDNMLAALKGMLDVLPGTVKSAEEYGPPASTAPERPIEVVGPSTMRAFLGTEAQPEKPLAPTDSARLGVQDALMYPIPQASPTPDLSGAEATAPIEQDFIQGWPERLEFIGRAKERIDQIHGAESNPAQPSLSVPPPDTEEILGEEDAYSRAA